jgi:hypothetical protein
MRFLIVSLMLVVGIGLGVPDAGFGQDGGSSSGGPDSLTVTGVIERLDLSAKKGLIKTATGKPVFFEIVKPELFKGMSIGQRVTLQLDEHGRAVKAIEMQSIPELPAPAQ